MKPYKPYDVGKAVRFGVLFGFAFAVIRAMWGAEGNALFAAGNSIGGMIGGALMFGAAAGIANYIVERWTQL